MFVGFEGRLVVRISGDALSHFEDEGRAFERYGGRAYRESDNWVTTESVACALPGLTYRAGAHIETKQDLKAIEQRRLNGARLLKRGITEA